MLGKRYPPSDCISCRDISLRAPFVSVRGMALHINQREIERHKERERERERKIRKREKDEMRETETECA